MTNEDPTPRRGVTPELVTTALDIAGALLVCGGVAAIYWPAGLILAGAAALAASWRASR